MAPVRHLEVHCVRPEGRVLNVGGDGGIVKESLLLHHSELVVATHAEVWRPQAHDRVVCDGGELLNDQSGTGHLSGPVLCPCLGPEALVRVVGDGVGGDLVAQPVHVLDGGVVGVVVGHEEGALDVTTVGVSALLVEDLGVEVDVSDVDRVVEGECDHLGDQGAPVVLGAEVPGDLGAVLGAEAVGQLAQLLITGGSAVGVGVSV